MGHVLQAVKDNNQVTAIVVVAMVARILKNMLRYQIRKGFESNTQKKAQAEFLNRKSSIYFQVEKYYSCFWKETERLLDESFTCVSTG